MMNWWNFLKKDTQMEYANEYIKNLKTEFKNEVKNLYNEYSDAVITTFAKVNHKYNHTLSINTVSAIVKYNLKKAK